MNVKRLFLVMGVGSGAIGLSAHGALLNLQQNTGSPYYADFTSSDLDVNYSYNGNSTSGTGTFKVSNPYTSGAIDASGEKYISGTDSPGSHGSFYNSGAGTGFTGSYSINATISYNNGVATLTGGTFNIYGTLMGGTSSSVLLSGSLESGAGGVAFGYWDPGQALSTGDYNTFQFLVNLGSLSGNTEILQDFLHGYGTTGGIIVDANFDLGHLSGGKTVYSANNGSTSTTANNFPVATTYQGFNGNWDQSFANPLGAGTADTFVPEPAAYSWGASIAALMACACSALRKGPFARRQSVG